jgi:hypothetical protein
LKVQERNHNVPQLSILVDGIRQYFRSAIPISAMMYLCWTTGSLKGYFFMMIILQLSKRLVCLSHNEDVAWSESSAKLAQEQLKILDLGFSELCRQVALECSQRSELMNRLWQASHEIYEKLLLEMTSAVESLRDSGNEWRRKCEKVPHSLTLIDRVQLQGQLDAQEWRHSQEIKRIESAAKTSKSEDSVIYRLIILFSVIE